MSTQPPGPKGLPVVGNIYHYARDPFEFMEVCQRTYGDVVALDLGGRDAYLVADPDAIGTILREDNEKYTKAQFRDDAIDQLLGDGMLLSEGDTWRQQRQLAQPAFGMDRLRGLGELMTDHTERMLADWTPGDTVDVHFQMARVTVQIITEAMFDVELSDERAAELREALMPVGDRFEPDPRRVVIPEWVPTEENRNYRSAVATLDETVQEFAAERRAREDYDESEDLLARLLRAHDAGEIGDDQLRDELVTMLLAGHDTTALALTYAWYLLDENPDTRERLHEELEEVLGDDEGGVRVPTVDDLSSMRYTEAVLQESMRLYPPVYSLFRQPKLDVRIGGYRIPAGAVVMLPQWIVHRDPRWWDDPEQFRPERFLEKRGDRPPDAYFPFGAGPRQCIGKHLSLMEGRLILGTVAGQYELERATDRPLDLQGTLTMHPRDPVEMTVHER